MKKKFVLPAVGCLIIFGIVLGLSVGEVRAQNQSTVDIAERLRVMGVPVKYVNIVSRIPYGIEIAVQSSSTDNNLSVEDNWFTLLAQHEATFAYRIATRVNSYKLIVFNAKGETVYSMQAFLHPEDLSQQLPLPSKSRLDDEQTRQVIKGELKFGDLALDNLAVIPESAPGNIGQILFIQVSTKNVEEANKSLPDFLDSLFQILRKTNSQNGTYVVLCHLKLVDSQGQILLDYVKDVESGSTQWTSTAGLYDEWYPHPNTSQPQTYPTPTVLQPTQAYPAPSEPKFAPYP